MARMNPKFMYSFFPIVMPYLLGEKNARYLACLTAAQT